MIYNITIGNKTIEITESGYNIFWDLTLSIIV